MQPRLIILISDTASMKRGSYRIRYMDTKSTARSRVRWSRYCMSQINSHDDIYPRNTCNGADKRQLATFAEERRVQSKGKTLCCAHRAISQHCAQPGRI